MMIGGNFLRRLWTERKGAVAVQFALLALPLIVLAFGVVDISHAGARKRQIQDALDAATLAAARSTAVTDGQLQAVGEAALKAQLSTMKDATLSTSAFTTVSPAVNGTAQVKLKPFIAGLWTDGDMIVGASSQVVRSLNKLEVVMVLDNTGSMSGSKLTNTKLAAKQLIDTLAAGAARSAEADAVKIGIVPFSTTVRLGSTSAVLDPYRTASWLDNSAAIPYSNELFSGNTNRFTLLNNMGVSWGGCVESRPQPYDVQDTAPASGTKATLFVPYFWPDEPDSQLKSSNQNANFGSFENDYLTDERYSLTNWKRPQAYIGKYDEAPSGSGKGPNRGCDMEPISRLSKNWTNLKASVDRMVAVGETHVPIGAMWGWHLLTPNAPFADGRPYTDTKVTKIMVLMTDGDNTYGEQSNSNQSAYDGYGYIWQNRLGITSGNSTARTNAMNARLALVCTNMKAKGIVIYSMGVMVSNSSKSLLQACATNSEMYYDVTSTGAISTAFSAIAGSIDNLRISR